MACERKQGISNLELMCQELLQEEQAKELKREQKRQKRKKKKTKQKQSTEVDIDAESELCGEKENCLVGNGTFNLTYYEDALFWRCLVVW